MHAVMNDISFRYPFANKRQAIGAVREWLDICRILKSQKCTKIHGLIVGNIDREFEIAPDYKWIQLLQEFTEIEDRRQLLTILQNADAIENEEGVELFTMQGYESALCTYAYRHGDVCISVESDSYFSGIILMGKIGEEEAIIHNLAQKDQISEVEEFLGIRRYESNPKHSMKSYERKGMMVSIMDLGDDEAQRLLDTAVEVEGCLYTKYKGMYYQFPRTRANIYHGFRNDVLTEEKKYRIDKISALLIE
ncbi:MAG: hypothetical protein PHE02_01885 [Lachnospiraceae bacterium]|nr:hypothetical protein [Lachnospiraceae bacterium]